MGQIFEHQGWVKRNNRKIIKKLLELNLNRAVFKYFTTFDRKDIIIKNYVYLLRLNNRVEKDYFDSIILIKLILIYYHMHYIKRQKVQKQGKEILQAINKLAEQIILHRLNINYETELFGTIDHHHHRVKPYYPYHLLYAEIANVFYQPFLDHPQGELYYEYGYLLVMLINLNVIKKMLNDTKNVEVYKVKLLVTSQCHYAIADITPVYFNYFIQYNNYFLQKY
ncbi:hypothetical protein [Spiroplasma eriocheiris]|uniref:Uncharacterized protein n=1 Tax=Spiroplasma eriocheiris TaxID=315358 RepID=A0A0H3XMG7_9MOLU|nr:hypothetical protein [Spiroplasma eriocheiris]AHF57671.1 hypothetical protein SPE_0543 [Spiroplasma eriocheiris CCTCC M 207170]AKM54122.1 hypothetical protein SERIO_v1c05500 [Spiroplasma eriocheiris]